MTLIRERTRVREEARANGHQEVPGLSEEERHTDDVIREYVEVLAYYGFVPEDFWGFPLQRGLTPKRIDQFSQFEATESHTSVTGNQCAVCLNEIQVGTKVLRLDCRHTFCSTCILQWFSTNNTCPYCRRSFL